MLEAPNLLIIWISAENWFSVDEKEPIDYALVKIIEAADMKPSDLNGWFKIHYLTFTLYLIFGFQIYTY